MELLCVAIGSCFGRELVELCAETNTNPRVFQSIVITMENFIPKIILSHPKDIDQEILEDISLIVKTCPISKMLINEVKIEFIENDMPTEDLIDESKDTSCCGGGHARND